MTDEQIKQNAEAYVSNLILSEQEEENYKFTFIDGAHSRDEEIKELEERIHTLELGAKVNEYFSEAKEDRLRHPWIRVEERLPKNGDMVFVHMKGGSCDSAIYTNGAFERSLQLRFGMKDGGHTIMIWEQKFKSNITHWMPIPQLLHDDMLINGLNEMNEHFKKGDKNEA